MKSQRLIGIVLAAASFVGLAGISGCALFEDKDFGRKVNVALSGTGGVGGFRGSDIGPSRESIYEDIYDGLIESAKDYIFGKPKKKYGN